jgi:hypothetical protein
MDFEETRLYYSHQQLHQPQNTTTNDGRNNDTTDPTNPVTPDNSNNNNDEDDDSNVPIEAVQRHLREFLRKLFFLFPLFGFSFSCCLAEI